MSARKSYLTRRDKGILAFIERYRAVTCEMLQMTDLLASTRSANVKRIVRRLAAQRLIHYYQYRSGQQCLTISRRGCVALGLPSYARRPLTEHSMPVAWAVAWYCLRARVMRLTDREFRSRLPNLWQPGSRSSNYYLFQHLAHTNLGMFVVDRGSTPSRLPGKIRRIIRQRDELPAFVALMESARFRVTVLTGFAGQQLNLCRQLQGKQFGNVDVQVAVVPELGPLLTMR